MSDTGPALQAAERTDRPPDSVLNTMPEVLRHWAERRAHEQAFSFLDNGERESASLSFSQLYGKALAIADQLRRAGLVGQTALLIYPPGLDFVAAFCGCLCAGVIAVPTPYLLPRRSGERIAAIGRAAEPAAILTVARVADDAALRAAMLQERAPVPWIVTDDLAPATARAGFDPPAPDAIAFLQFTSGSTGAPKGIALTQANIMANQAMICQAFGHDAETRVATWLPAFHDMGLIGGVLQPLYLGIPCVMMSPLSFLQKPVRWLRAISDHRATSSGAPNFAYGLCAQHIRPEQCDGLDLGSWRVAFCGAEPVRPDTLEGFAARFAPSGFGRQALYPCYGLAEATLFVSGGEPGGGLRTRVVDRTALSERGRAVKTERGAPQAHTLASSGRGWGAGRIEIVRPDTQARAAPGEVGEIWISGPHVGAGYWRAPAETARVFEARIDGDPAPYLRSGDLGFVLDGALFVTGRLKDLLIVRGAKHHPEEIEATVARSHAALAGGGGAAFMIEDEGEPRLVILQEIERRSLLGLDAEAVARTAFGAVTGQHGIRPDELMLLRPGALPRTTSGKIQRHRCRDAYRAGTLAVVAVTGPAPWMGSGGTGQAT